VLPSLQQKVETECRDKILIESEAESILEYNQQLSFVDIKKSQIFLPAYLLRYVHEKSEHTVIINGQTGAIKGQRPWGLGKLGSFFFGSKKT